MALDCAGGRASDMDHQDVLKGSSLRRDHHEEKNETQ